MSFPSEVHGATVELRGVSRMYADMRAVDDVSLTVQPGEFISLLGPSGSGKTTTLNIVAGFDEPTSGDVLVDGRSVTKLPAHKREMGMVFQNYALFPHMTVGQNVAFPLRERRVPKDEVQQRVQAALDMVDLGRLSHRYPAQLSGGQQQRVALARSIVYRPRVLLMDEPMGALDKKLRSHLQIELKNIHRELGTTILFVTHDQDEALALSDRIALFRSGRIEQVGIPEELWDSPRTPFTADFLGESNLIAGTLQNGTFRARGHDLIPPTTSMAAGAHTLLLRPERVRLRAATTMSPRGLRGMLTSRMFMGSSVHVTADTTIGSFRAIAGNDAHLAELRIGDEVEVSWAPEDSVLIEGVDASIDAIGDRSWS